MECELVRLAGVPIGLVTSALFYSTDTASSGEQEDASELTREVQIAVCPTGRLLAFIASFKAQFVACAEPLHAPVAGGADLPVSTYHTTYEGLLKLVRDPNTPRPVATAVVVVPVTLESRKESSSIVLVGFSDGYIRAYSKMGVNLFSQCLHGEAVVQIRCMAPSGDLQNGTCRANVSLLVVFQSLVCVVEGGSVCEAVAHAVEAIDEEMGEEDEEGEVPVISYKKWRLGDQGKTIDAALLAPSLSSAYDYLCEAGNVGGYDTTVKGGPTPQSHLIVVGESPMVSLYKISKDAGTVNVSEVVSAVASKMTRSVLGKLSQAGGWLGWGGGGTQPSRAKPPPEKKMILNLPMSTNIPDERRAVSSISVSPLGDLSVCVDAFGRVLLLENHAMTIRRMWKGYRDAQTGWLLVPETSTETSVSGAHRRKRGRSPSGGGGRVRGERGRRAQCLCIYLPRRGLLELWPVQNGGRVAVFQVGKGCRLLMAPHGTISSSKSEEDPGDREGWGKGCGLRETAVLLCPNGHLLSFLVPFPTLVRLNDSSSHDAHLLQKLSPVLQSGDLDGLLQILATFKTTHSLRDAVERVMHSYPVSGLPAHYPAPVLRAAVRRTSPSEPGHRGVREYLAAVRQLFHLHLGLGQISSSRQPSPSPSSPLPKMLAELCGLSGEAAVEVAGSLQHYAACRPSKLQTHVVRSLSLRDLLRCFSLPGKTSRRGAELRPGGEEGVVSGEGVATGSQRDDVEKVSVNVKKGISEASLSDLSFALFHVLLTQDVAEKSVRSLLTGCGVPPPTLLTLLIGVFLSGRVVPPRGDPRPLLLRLHHILHTITSLEGGGRERMSEALAEVRRQCSHTHNAGHALLLILLCQRLVSEWNRDVGGEREEGEGEGWGGEGDWGGGEEGWETVTEEGEQWVRLQLRLEVLTCLCGVVGLAIVSRAPPLPLLRRSQEMESGDEGGSVSVALLEEVGPWLIANCVAHWLVSLALSPRTIASLPSPPLTDPPSPGEAEVVGKLGPLLRMFARSLSGASLLVHSAWQASLLWHSDPAKHSKLHEYILQCISLIPSPQVMAGTCLFLWHSVFESSLVDLLDRLKRGSQQRPGAVELASLSRRIFTYLYQLGEGSGEKGKGRGETEGSPPQQDSLLIPVPTDKRLLMDVAPVLPLPPAHLLRAYLSLLLHTELALLLGPVHNVASFYPSWVRTATKKGLLSCSEGGRPQQAPPTPPQLQHKRTKFLCEAVTQYLDSASPKLRPPIPSPTIQSIVSLATPSRPRLEVAEVTSALFLLGELWGVEVDGVRRHFVSSLFAAGLGDRGTEAFQSVVEKPRAARDLLSLAGSLTDSLLQQLGSRPQRLALTAQLPPSQLEWIRKQSSSGVVAGCLRVSPTWASLSQLLSVIKPHLPPPSSSSSSQLPSTSSATIAQTLAKIAAQQSS